MNIRRRRLGLFAGAVVATLAASSVSADVSRLRARVPFSFTVNGAAFAPGDYAVTTAGHFRTMLAVNGGRSRAYALSIPIDRAPGTQPRLVFHRYGDAYVLREVWLGDGEGHALRESAAARRLRETPRPSDPYERVTVTVGASVN